jgi:signal transduction histidine kinase
VQALESYLGPGRAVNLYAQAPEGPRWLAGSAGVPPDRPPLAQELVSCGTDGLVAREGGDARSQRRLASVAAGIGIQLQRLALRAEGECAGARAERERLAGDIHDTIAQSLGAVTTHLEAATSALSSRASDAAGHIQAATASARTALAELRGLVWTLRPADSRVTLSAALQRCAERAALESGVPIEVALEPVEAELSPEIELCLLRAAQEALRNAVRHGAPRSVRLALARSDQRIVLTVEDDGAGFDPAAVQPVGTENGHGLDVMTRRAARLGGEQVVVSDPGRGTRITVKLPLPDRSARP